MSNINTELLNALHNTMIEVANEKGVSLKSIFATSADFKNFVISYAIQGLCDLGMSNQQAYDLVMGSGEYEKLASSLYEHFESKQLNLCA